MELARRLNGEVVSCDSMQLYRGMDIGTAKVSPGEMQGVTHHMIDVAEPGEDFSVSRYTELAQACLEDIAARGKRPVVVGGTALYMDSLVRGGEYLPQPPAQLRSELMARAASEDGRAALMEQLRQVDPISAERLHPNNTKRLVRALEVWYLTGVPISEHDRLDSLRPPRHEALRIILTCADRALLYRRIDCRVDQMMQQGLLEEVRRLLDRGIGGTAMQAIGYKEMTAALRDELSLDEAVEAVKQGSRRYAKRQLTWLRRYPEALWLEVDRLDFAELIQRSTDYLRSRGVG